MEKMLVGSVALVTGSGRGLGYAIANRLAALGADIALHDISPEAPAEFGEFKDLDDAAAKLRRDAGKTMSVVGDISDEVDVARMVQTIEAELGPIAILINCAGGDIAARGSKPVPNDALGIPLEDVHAILSRNLIGTMLMCRAVCPGMQSRGRGSVVNIASAAAHMGCTPGVAYSVAKAGIVQFTRCLALELRPSGVRANVLSPGPTKTARFLVTRETDPELMDDRASSLKRYATPAEIADAVAFLAGPEARFISGQVLRVDGGMNLYAA